MTVRFIQARNYTKGPRNCAIDVIVLHTMENEEKPEGAENVALWFAGSTAPQASAHYCIDSNSVVQCVRDSDIAWAAPPCNHNGLQLEHAGRAAQNRADWADPYSQAELRLSAKLAASLCKKYKIPVRWLSVADLKAGRKGLASHANVSAAFHKSNHTDPGPNFPIAQYLALVSTELKKLQQSKVKQIVYVIKRRSFKNSGIPTEMTTVEPKGTPGGEEI